MTRPRRPKEQLAKDPVSSKVVYSPADIAEHQSLVLQRLRHGDLPQQVWTVSFANRRPKNSAGDGYKEVADEMDTLASQQPGFIDVHSVRSDGGEGITVSRWSSIAAMVSWRKIGTHISAQNEGRSRWYEWYRSDVSRVDRTSTFVS